MKNRKALVVGIDKYNDKKNSLAGCCNDANEIGDLLEWNENGSRNFDVRRCFDIRTKGNLRQQIKECFSGNFEIALFYYSGHGYIDSQGGYLVTPDSDQNDPGVSLQDILNIANQSKCLNRIIILDSCYSGYMGSISTSSQDTAVINEGVTIMTACRNDQTASMADEYSVFTSLLIEALMGEAADLTGHVTVGGIYAFIDKALGPWGQRPVFKTNVTSFTSLREVTPQVNLDIIRKLCCYFDTPDAHFRLDPSFEITNSLADKHEVIEPYAKPENVKIFKELQKLEGVGLVTPVGEEHMYFAAMKSKACALTAVGKQYWNLVKHNRI